MKKLLAAAAILTLSIVVAGCGSGGGADRPSDAPSAGDATAVPEGPAPTRIVLATPTPLPPPPTPTPIPPTPAPEATEAPEEATPADGTPEPAEEPAAQPPSVTDIMIEIPAGPFTMGSDDTDPEDGPAQQMDLAAYEIDRFEVTNADFDVFAKTTGYLTYAEQQGLAGWRNEWDMGEDNHPVAIVTWDDATAYCEWLGKRLPTEAEWEKAARGEDGRRFPWGSDWDPSKANVKETGLRGTVAVGSFGAGSSAYGADDMTGNVWEWTADWYQAYPGNTAGDPYYGEQFRVTRGGGWFDEEPQSTTYNRNAADPTKTANDDLGFRCAR